MTPPLDPALVERFRGDMVRLLASPPNAAHPLGIAVSGGADSMALLALAAEAFPGAAIAATVDHGLRLESAAETAMVAGWCAATGIRHTTLAADVVIAGAGVQAQARALRYRLLDEWAAGQGALAIATAHHADDQAETFVMRAVRGTGLAGLRGIPARRETGDVPVVRPLLEWRRAELRALAQTAQLPFVDDPSNADPAFERVRIRALLTANPALDPAAIARSARHLADADDAIEQWADRLWDDPARIERSPGAVRMMQAHDLPRELRRRLLGRAIAHVRATVPELTGSWSPAANLEAMLAALDDGGSATQAGVLARSADGIWHVTVAPPRRSR